MSPVFRARAHTHARHMCPRDGIPSLLAMRFVLDGLPVVFPYDALYPEQLRYMGEVKRALDAKGDGLLEMPTGTGKTVSILSIIMAYQAAHPEVGKLIYCTRTVPEMVKAVEEIKRVAHARQVEAGSSSADLLALCLSSRRNMYAPSCHRPQARACVCVAGCRHERRVRAQAQSRAAAAAAAAAHLKPTPCAWRRARRHTHSAGMPSY